MPHAHSSATYSRRGFLHAAGAAATLAVLAAEVARPVAAAATGPAGATAGFTARQPLRLATLLPRSAAYPQLGPAFLAGLRLAFAEENLAVEMRTAEIGGGVGLLVPQAAETLDAAATDLLVGMVNPEVAAGLRVLLSDRDVAFLNAGIGANLPRASDASPQIFHHTLGYWQASWALGQWAASALGRRALLSASFHDSGFDAPFAFRLGFEAAGGTVVFTHTTHVPPDATSAADLVAPLLDQRADFVYAAYSGDLAAEFVRAYAASGLAGSLPLIGTAPGASLGVHAAAWSSDLATAENRRFVAAYRAQTGQTPELFALLGYETARLIAAAATGTGKGLSLREALASASFVGPRGAVAMDGATRETTGPVYLLGDPRGGIAALATPAAGDRAIMALRHSLKTGWLAPYFCV